jgi:hypothetical protein
VPGGSWVRPSRFTNNLNLVSRGQSACNAISNQPCLYMYGEGVPRNTRPPPLMRNYVKYLIFQPHSWNQLIDGMSWFFPHPELFPKHRSALLYFYGKRCILFKHSRRWRLDLKNGNGRLLERDHIWMSIFRLVLALLLLRPSSTISFSSSSTSTLQTWLVLTTELFTSTVSCILPSSMQCLWISLISFLESTMTEPSKSPWNFSRNTELTSSSGYSPKRYRKR